jgi:beta-glucosidase
VTVTLRNDSERATREVVQVYLHDPVAEVARPVQQLIAATPVELEPGDISSVVLRLSADLTSYTGRAGQRVVDTGPVELRVGASSEDVRACLELEMTGRRRVIGRDRVMQPRIDIRYAETPARKR